MLDMQTTSTEADDVFNYYFLDDKLKMVLEDALFYEFAGNNNLAIRSIFESFYLLRTRINRSNYKPIWYQLISFNIELAKEILELAIDQKEKFESWET